jgi:hypothetical protein
MIMINKKINIVKKSVFKIFATAAILLPLAFSSCIHDNFEEPPVVDITQGIPLTIDQIYQIHNDSVVNLENNHTNLPTTFSYRRFNYG